MSTNEKWVVVELHHDFSGVIDVHGVFSDESEAYGWARDRYFTYDVKRVRKAHAEEWA